MQHLKQMEFNKVNLAIILLIFCNALGFAQTTKQLISSSQADSWVAVDGLGRQIDKTSLPGIRKDKYVGMFYFIWQGAHGYDKHNEGIRSDEGVIPKTASNYVSPYDISKLLAVNPNQPAYGPLHAFHYWAEPHFGYYLPDDEWIIRKHAQMLSDAGVDVIILDVTNAAIYLPQVTKIAETYLAMRKAGISTPAIAFIVNSDPIKTVNRLYDQIYSKGLFKELWFNWKGKPLLLAPPEGQDEKVKTFFNIRQSWAWSKGEKWFGDGKDKWTWLDHTPQSYGWHENQEKPEQISVSIAEHPISNIGRSFHNGKEPELKNPGAGLYFSEQWKRALEVDPEFVFVTGWNEWVAMRFNEGQTDNFLGKPIKKGDTYFVDLYNEEYSRDAEPMKGGFSDNYYYQLVNNIRAYKGGRTAPVDRKLHILSIDGDFSDWKNVGAVYLDDQGDTFHRNHPGWGSIKAYVNNSGRNDIIEARAASDKNYVYFYVKTAKPMTSWQSPNWMNLFIGIQNKEIPSWEGFNFLANRKPLTKNSTSLERNGEGVNWASAGKINYEAKGNEMELRIARKDLGITSGSYVLNFKWTDNVAFNGSAVDWLDQGDTAPNGRFRYRYELKLNEPK